MKKYCLRRRERKIIRKISRIALIALIMLGSIPLQRLEAYAQTEPDIAIDIPDLFSKESFFARDETSDEDQPLIEASQSDESEGNEEISRDSEGEDTDSLQPTLETESELNDEGINNKQSDNTHATYTAYDQQPQTKEAVAAAIAAYEEKKDTANKPRWQFLVAETLMPHGYYCALVYNDTDFGQDYYTFFVQAQETSGTEHVFTGETRSELDTFIRRRYGFTCE